MMAVSMNNELLDPFKRQLRSFFRFRKMGIGFRYQLRFRANKPGASPVYFLNTFEK